MNVGLFTSVYFNNIGNGFIDLGAEEALKRALPEEANLIKLSQCANYAASMSRFYTIKENVIVNFVWKRIMQRFSRNIHDKTYNVVETLNVSSIPRMVDLDYLVIPGCVLTVHFFKIYGELLKEKTEQGCKLIFLGASGNYYTDFEIDSVSKWLELLKPFAIMTRDSMAYEKYSRFSQNSFNGIDNAFFVNLLNIPSLKTNPKDYVVINLEEPRNARIKKELEKECKSSNKEMIFSNHKPYPYSNLSKMIKKGIIVSDYPQDYLILYKNATEVYSDRVHACIPTLSFGNKAKLFSNSERIKLFNNVEVEENEDGLMKLVNIEHYQEKQVSFLRELFEKGNC